MLKDSVAITSWAAEDRPREKMLSKGKNALSDAELLAILIGTGSGKNTAVDLGRSLLQLCNGDLYELGRLRLPQMCFAIGCTIFFTRKFSRQVKNLQRTMANYIATNYQFH
jgi:DNA repair protein RadC